MGLVPSTYTCAVSCNIFDYQVFLQPKVVPDEEFTVSQPRELFPLFHRGQHIEPRLERDSLNHPFSQGNHNP
jgi:hypothetical protein